MTKDETEKILKETIEYANSEIKSFKKKYLKNFYIVFVIVLTSIILFLIVFEYEIPVKYNKNLIQVNIPLDQGLDIKINLSNYKNAKALLVKIDEDSYDLYINITQSLVTKIFTDNDKSDNVLRVGNGIIIDFNSNTLRGVMPNKSSDKNIKHIYYVDNLSSKIMVMENDELINYTNKVLIWERET